MVEVEVNNLELLKTHLLKSNSHFGGAKFSRMTRNFSDEEKIKLFGDPQILKRIFQLENYDVVAAVFRVVPAEIQELMWDNIFTQKILLGMEKVSDEKLIDLIKRNKFFLANEPVNNQKMVGKFYYGPAKLRALQVLLRFVKSEKIIHNLPYNKYFQMILLCCYKVPESFYSEIDIETTFHEICNSELYKIGDKYSRINWIQQVNNNCPKFLIPENASTVFGPSKTFTRWYYSSDSDSIAAMIDRKLRSLAKKNMKADLSFDVLKRLNLQEINVLKNDENNVVDQEIVNEILNDIIDNAFEDGTIFSKKYLDMSNLDVPVQATMFKMIVDKSIGNPQYEKQLLDYLFSVLFTNQYNELEKQALMLSLKNSLVYASEEILVNLFSNPSDIKSVFFLRFNTTGRNMGYLHGISISQLMRINVKHINRIVKLVYDPTNDELSDSYSKAIKLYMIFGLERTVELLSGNYPINKRFLDNVIRLDVSKVEMKSEGKRYLPILNEEFVRFMFNPYNIDAIFDEDAAMSTTWYYLYNNFEKMKDLCKGHITLAQAETILKEQVNTVRYDLDPDCYRLEKILYEAGLGNKMHYSNETIYDEMCKIHKEQIKRITSTIPYVKGTLESGWGYEIMRYDSAIAYVLGYRANCCIRVKDIAHNHLLHALLCKSGRILLTYKPDGTIASFSPLKRNGEVLIANSIETIDKSESVSKQMVEAFSEGMKEICRLSKESEEKNWLKVATIGVNSGSKLVGEPWPPKVPTPTILEKDDPVYRETDAYHKRLTVFYKDDNVNLGSLKYGKTEHEYYDPRNEILACLNRRDEVIVQQKIMTIIDSIRYRKMVDSGDNVKKFERMRNMYHKALFCNEDWYIIIDYCNRIHYDCIEDDPRALKEMNAVLETIGEYSKTNNIEDYVLKLTGKKA